MGLVQSIQRQRKKPAAGSQENLPPSQEENVVEADQEHGKIDESRIVELMQNIKRIERLRREAATAQIEARQKRREAAIKRREVWMCDAKFMEEIQHLSAKGELSTDNDLTRLAAKCQDSRNVLGPVEQEGIDAEQRWEQHTWLLQQAEIQLLTEFDSEFAIAETYPSGPSSVASSQYKPPSGHESSVSTMEEQSGLGFGRVNSVASSISIQHLIQGEEDFSFPVSGSGPQLSIISDLVASPSQAGLEQKNMYPTAIFSDFPENASNTGLQENNDKYATESSSGVGDIDRSLGHVESLPDRQYAALEIFPCSTTDFSSKRTMINQWLENNVLTSHFEAVYLFSALKATLDAEDKAMPSNWAELVIAFWKLDGAANPRFHESASNPDRPRKKEARDETENEKNDNAQPLRSDIINCSREGSITDHGYCSDDRASRGRQSFPNLTDGFQMASPRAATISSIKTESYPGLTPRRRWGGFASRFS